MTNEEKDKKEEENKQYIRRLLDSEAETRAEPPIEKEERPVTPDGTTRASPPKKTPNPSSDQHRNTPTNIPLDRDNMPLPRRVDEVDMEGTRVTPVAYEPSSRPRNGVPQTRISAPTSQPRSVPISQPRPRTREIDLSTWGGCLGRILVLALFGVVVLTIIVGSGLLFFLLFHRAHAAQRGRPAKPRLAI